MTPEVKDELDMIDTEADAAVAVDNAAVVETTEELQDEVSDGVAAVLPMLETEEEEDEREQAPAMAEAA